MSDHKALASISYSNPILVAVENDDSRVGQLFRLHHSLQLGQKTHVLRHVSGQHHVDDHFSDDAPLLLVELGEDVARLVLQNLEGDGQVVVLQHRVVVVHEGQLGAFVYQVLVG